MSFASNLQAVASRLLSSKGELCSFSRKIEGAYDVSTAATAASTDTTYTAYGAPSKYKNMDADGNLSREFDLVLLAYSTTKPLIGDVCTLDSTAYRVMDVEQLRAQGSNIAYRLGLKL